MNRLNPIDPTQPRRVRGDPHPTKPGWVFSAYQRRPGGTHYESWAQLESFARAQQRKAEDAELRLDTLEGQAGKLLAGARARLKRRGVVREIDQSAKMIAHVAKLIKDADGKCPALGVAWTRDNSGTSMTLDRILPELGYVIGNVMVISMRANSAKYNVTGPQRLLYARTTRMTRREQLLVAKYITFAVRSARRALCAPAK